MEPTTSATAPASATAAPVAAATAATTSPVSTPVSTPVTSPVVDGQGGAGALSDEQRLSAMVESATKAGYKDDLSQTKPAASASTPTSETAATNATSEVAEAPAASETQVESPAQDSDSYSLEEDGFVGPKDLAAKIESNPALKAALPEDVRNEIMANARLAEVGAAYRELFASPAEAKIIQQTAQDHASFSEAFNQISGDAEKGTTALVMKLIEASALRDAEGKPLMYEDGKTFKTDGTANAFIKTLGQRWLTHNVVEKIKALGDENVQAALDLVMESAGLQPSTADKTQDQDPALAARKAELDAQEARIRQERETSEKQSRQEYTTSLEGDLASLYDGEVGKLLGLATGLTPFAKKTVERDLEVAIRSAIKQNTAYQMRKNQLQSQARSSQRRQQEVALAKEFFRDNLRRIAKPILAEAGVAVGKKAAERQAAQAARVENARSEVSGGATSTGSTAQPGPVQNVEQARVAYKAANGGKEPSDSDLNIFLMLEAAKRKGYPV